MSTQDRLYWRGAKRTAESLYGALEVVFEDDPVVLAIQEVDEAAQISEVSVYAAKEEASDVARRFAEAGEFELDAIERETLPDQDWMAGVLAELKPVRAGRFLVHGAHDRDRVAANDLSIEIEAGQAFGTGHHGTTAGCLAMLSRIAKRGYVPENALDLGTGSAVLAIGIAKLMRVPVLATDNDARAVAVARENVAANGASALVSCALAEGFAAHGIGARAPYDLIVANILAGPLIALARSFPEHLDRNGAVILSGILEGQRSRVLAAFRAQGLIHRETIRLDGWVTLRLSR